MYCDLAEKKYESDSLSFSPPTQCQIEPAARRPQGKNNSLGFKTDFRVRFERKVMS